MAKRTRYGRQWLFGAGLLVAPRTGRYACASGDPTPGWGAAPMMCGVTAGKVTITLARAASFQHAGDVGQLAAIRFAGSAVSSSFEEALTDVVVAGLRLIAEARRSRTG